MSITDTNKERVISYTTATLKRAEIALCCSSFRLNLFAAMQSGSVPLPEISSESGFEQGYTKKIITEAKVESELMWLIQVGLLRREVDGQGITDSFRLTPLGRQLLEKWQSQGGELPSPSWLDRLFNILNRWLRFFL